MKIKGVPAHVWQGNAEVYVYGTQCPLLQACHICDFCCRIYYQCVNGHAICPECQWGKTKCNKDQAACKVCTKPAFRIELSTELVEKMIFRCGCGSWGKLDDIRVHRGSYEYSEKCDGPPDDQDPIMVDLKSDLEEVEMVLGALKHELQAKLDRIRSVSTNLTIEVVDKDRYEQSKMNIEELRKRADEMILIYHELRDENQQIRAMLDAVTSPTTVQTFSIKSLIGGCREERTIALISMRIGVKLILGPDGRTDLFVRASFKRGSRHPQRLVKKLLVVRHLDHNGYTLREASFEIQPDGTLGREDKPENCLIDHAENNDCRKARSFIDPTYIFGPSAQFNDSLHISVELCHGSTRCYM